MYEMIRAWWSFLKRWQQAPPHDEKSWARFVDDERVLYDRIRPGVNENEEKLLVDLLCATAEFFRREDEACTGI